MSKTINTNKSVPRQIFKALLVILLTPVALILLVILYVFISDPIYNMIDKNKFTTLDSQSRSLYEQIKTASNGVDDWKYMAVCSNDSQNWMMPEYNCITSISTEKNISSIAELNALHAKYYPVVEKSDIWAKHELANAQSLGDFVEKFNVSLAYNDYKELKTNTECTYQIQLSQIEKNINYQTDNHSFGSAITAGEGDFFISIRCDATALDKWYDLVDATSTVIPEI